MRVLLAHNRYRSSQPSGEDRVVDTEGAALAAAGHDVLHFERASDDIARLPRARQALVPAKVIWSLESQRDMAARLRRDRPDVVHVHNTFPLMSPSVLAACRSAGVPAVVTFHNYRPLCPSGDFFRSGAVCHECAGRLPVPGLVHGCYRDSRAASVPLAASVVAHGPLWRRLPAAVVFVSDSERRLFEPLGLPAERVFVKPNLVPRPDVPPEPRCHRVAFLGRLSESKGLPVLMAAWDRFCAERPDSRLELAIGGAGPLEDEVGTWASRHPGPAGRVEMLGLLDRAACSRLVSSSRAVLVPSIWEETFGLVVVEAMGYGTPSIVSSLGSLAELVTDGRDGRHVRAGDAAGLASLLAEVDDAPGAFEDLGWAAAKTYEERFTPEANLEALVGIYRFAAGQT